MGVEVAADEHRTLRRELADQRREPAHVDGEQPAAARPVGGGVGRHQRERPVGATVLQHHPVDRAGAPRAGAPVEVAGTGRQDVEPLLAPHHRGLHRPAAVVAPVVVVALALEHRVGTDRLVERDQVRLRRQDAREVRREGGRALLAGDVGVGDGEVERGRCLDPVAQGPGVGEVDGRPFGAPHLGGRCLLEHDPLDDLLRRRGRTPRGRGGRRHGPCQRHTQHDGTCRPPTTNHERPHRAPTRPDDV